MGHSNPRGIHTLDDLLCRVTKIDSCWLWNGVKNDRGYASAMWRGKNVHVHKLAYELLVGLVPSGMDVCHKCDVRTCVNPDHLFIATHLENIRDRDKKNRQAKGEQNARSKLTEEQVREIRRKYKKGVYGYGCRKLAKEYGITHPNIYEIIKGRHWSWVK